MYRIFVLVCLVASLMIAPFPARTALAQPIVTEDAAVEGVLVFDKRYVTVQPSIPGEPMRVGMRFDPQDQQELRRRSGFFCWTVLGYAPFLLAAIYSTTIWQQAPENPTARLMN